LVAAAHLDGGLQRLDQFIAAETAAVGDLVLACKLTQVLGGQRGERLGVGHGYPCCQSGAPQPWPGATWSAVARTLRTDLTEKDVALKRPTSLAQGRAVP
jgi:hypothetical protein